MNDEKDTSERHAVAAESRSTTKTSSTKKVN